MCAPTKNQILCPLPPPTIKKSFSPTLGVPRCLRSFVFWAFFFVSDLTKTQKSQYKLLLSEVISWPFFLENMKKKVEATQEQINSKNPG